MIGKLNNLKRGIKSAFVGRKNAGRTLFLTVLFFIAIALSSSIEYSYQMFSSGPQYWLQAIQLRVAGLYAEGGFLGFSMTALYSVLIGITLSNLYNQFRNNGVKKRNITGIGPGFIAAGCAGCGVGILGLLGVTGGLATLPFNGSLIRISGMGLLVYYIAKTGDPKTCSIPSS